MFLLAVLLAPAGYGQLAQNLTMGNAKAIALANAVTADPPGIDAIHYNPAGLALLSDRQIQLKLVSGQFTIKAGIDRTPFLNDLLTNTAFEETLEPGTSETSDVSTMLPFSGLTEIPVLLAPLGGISITTPNKQFTFGNAVYAPMMVGYKREKNNVARYQGNELGFTHLTYFSPSFAVRINEHWMAGVTLAFNYTGVGIDLDMRVTNEVLGVVEDLGRAACDGDQPKPVWDGVLNLCEGKLGPFTPIGNLYLEVEDMFNPSMNFGVLWQPVSWFSWGAVYQTEAKTQLKGDFEFAFDPGWVAFFQGLNQSLIGSIISPFIPQGVASQFGEATLDFTIPAHFATGISVNVLPQLKVNLDAKWTNTAAWNEFKIEFDRSLDFLPVLSYIAPDTVTKTSLTFPRGYESTWSWAVGVEYQYTDRLALRAGFEDRPSAIPNDKTDLLAPFGAATLIGLGFSYKKSVDTVIDAGFGYLSSKSKTDANKSRNSNSTGFNNIIYNPYAGYDIKSEVTAYLLEFSYQSKF